MLLELCTALAASTAAQQGKDGSHRLAGPAGDVLLVLRSHEVTLRTPREARVIAGNQRLLGGGPSLIPSPSPQ